MRGKTRMNNRADDVLDLIKQTREKIIIYLGTQNHIASETKGTFIYPSDLSGRLTKLEELAGRYKISNNNTLSLWHLLELPHFNQATLLNFITTLYEISAPIPGFPKINKSLNKLIQACIENLMKAFIILGSLNKDNLTQKNKVSEKKSPKINSKEEDDQSQFVDINLNDNLSSFYATSFTTFSNVTTIQNTQTPSHEQGKNIDRTSNPFL